MKLIQAVTMILKIMLSLAGLALLISKLKDSKGNKRYLFSVASALKEETPVIRHRFKTKKKYDFSDLHKSYFQSMDYLNRNC